MKTKSLFVFLILNFFRGNVSAQSGYLPVSMPHLLLSSYHKEDADEAGFFFNQAALAGVNSPALVIFSEKKYWMDGQQLISAAFQFPSAYGNGGLVMRYESSGVWTRTALGFAWARRLHQLVDAGVQFNLIRERVPGYAGSTALSGELGLNFFLNSRLTAGIHFSNPVSFFRKPEDGNFIPGLLSAGLGYAASETFFLTAVMRCAREGGMEMMGGFEYRYMRRFFLRGGCSSPTGMYFLSTGMICKGSRWDFSFSVHPRLGVSSGLSWSKKFIKRKS